MQKHMQLVWLVIALRHITSQVICSAVLAYVHVLLFALVTQRQATECHDSKAASCMPNI